MPFRAIVLDLDGLMVDSEPLAKQAWRAVLARYGRVLDSDTINAVLGLRLMDSARLIQERYSLPRSVEQIVAEEDREFAALVDGNLRPMPGLGDLLREIDARGLLRAVATSSGRRYALMALRAVGAEQGFAAIITGDDVLRGKPEPDIYLAAAAALQVPPGACLALEDSPHGVQAAKAAGMCCVAVPNDLTAGLDLGPADWILPSLTSVAEQLDSLLRAPLGPKHGSQPSIAGGYVS